MQSGLLLRTTGAGCVGIFRRVSRSRDSRESSNEYGCWRRTLCRRPCDRILTLDRNPIQAHGRLCLASNPDARVAGVVIAHALRAWPTPFGAAINVSSPIFADDGTCVDEKIAKQLTIVASQVVEFAKCRQAGYALGITPDAALTGNT
jgi:hypothetical protein